MNQKRMFKVVCPIEKEGGAVAYWLRCGTGFVNKDNSINVYLDALPLRMKAGEGVKLQIREITDEEIRERAERKSSYSSRGTLSFDVPIAGAMTSSASHGVDAVPF